MKKTGTLIKLLTALTVFSISTTASFASVKGPSQMAVENKMNSEILYVIEKDSYRKSLESDVLSFELRNNILPINTANIKDSELRIIDSAETYFTLGDIENMDVLPVDNQGNIFYDDGQPIVDLGEVDTSKHLIISNQESTIDVINATQIGIIEGRNLLFIKDNRLSSETISFLSNYGEDKNILFIEGELEIPSELRNYILQLAGSPKYEIDNYKVSKRIDKEKIAITNLLPDKIPGSNIDVNKEGIFDKMQTSSRHFIGKASEKNGETVNNNNKVIYYEPEDQLEGVSADKLDSFVEAIKDCKDNDLLIQKNNKVEHTDTEEHVSLKLTYANPLSIHNYVPDSKDVYVTSKSISNEIIYSVMEGDYGVGEDRVINLEKHGYNYDEVQAEVEKVVARREKEAKEIEKRILKERGRIAQTASSSQLTKSFLNEAIKMQGWDYSQPNRWADGEADCSSLIIRALINTGYTSNYSNMTTRTIMNDPRFYEISMDQIRKGDILWYTGHVEIYMGGDTTFGAFRPGKQAGYASGVNRFSRAFRLSGK